MLVQAREARERREDRRSALIACVLANINRSSDDDPYDIRDFMPLTDEEWKSLEREKIKQSQLKFAAFIPKFAPKKQPDA